jgi:hypothetical protein
MHPVLAPEIVPALRGVQPGISKNTGSLLHALLKLDRKTEQRSIRQIHGTQSTMSKRDVDRALRFSAVPALTGSHFVKQPAHQTTGPGWVFKMKEDIPREGQVVTSQNKPLNIRLVELTHFGRPS